MPPFVCSARREPQGWGAGIAPRSRWGVPGPKVGGGVCSRAALLFCPTPPPFCTPRLRAEPGWRELGTRKEGEAAGRAVAGVHAVSPPFPVCAQQFTPQSERVTNVAHVDKDGGVYAGKPGPHGPHIRGRGAQERQRGGGLPPVRVVTSQRECACTKRGRRSNGGGVSGEGTKGGGMRTDRKSVV